MVRTLLPLLLLAGCPAASDEDKTGDTAGGEDSGGDDTGGGGGGGALGPCGAYTGYRAVGDTWTYGVTDEFTETSGYTGGRTQTVTVLSTSGGVTTIEVEGTDTLSSSSVDVVTTGWTSMHCDSVGLYLDASDNQTVTTIGGNSTTSDVQTTYEGFLVVPAGLAVGSTWSATVTGETTSSSGSYSFDSTYDSTATDETVVSTPAGDFTALTIDQEVEGGSTTSYWLDRDLGLVLSEYYELTAYTR